MSSRLSQSEATPPNSGMCRPEDICDSNLIHAPTTGPQPELSTGAPTVRRRSHVSGLPAFRDSMRAEDFASLTRSASAISGHDEASHKSANGRVVAMPSITRPQAAKAGPATTVRELPPEINTPYSTRPPSPVMGAQAVLEMDGEERFTADPYPVIGTIASWRGAAILIITCGSQLLDNVFMTAVNICLPAIQREFNVEAGNLQWLISAYTLTFGGFLLLSGVLSDR